VHGIRDNGQRIAAYFGSADEATDGVPLTAVLADDASGRLWVARSLCDGTTFASVVPEVAQAHLFEREIAEQYGVRFEGHPGLKPVRFHHSYR
jgi:Ni,Fe-hydrogenase III component G